MPIKWNAITALLDQARGDASDAWYINFASVASTSIPPIENDAPIDVAGYINPLLFGYLAGAPFANRLGTLMLDFPDNSMIERIMALNMPAAGAS